MRLFEIIEKCALSMFDGIALLLENEHTKNGWKVSDELAHEKADEIEEIFCGESGNRLENGYFGGSNCENDRKPRKNNTVPRAEGAEK